jgi:hypothetical protein
MHSPRLKVLSAVVIVGAIALSIAWESRAQNALPSSQAAGQDASVPQGMDPAAAKIWTSPQMLEARQWLADYCSHSAKVTPQEAKQYESELEGMSATQMKLWLLKFEEHEEIQQQQYQAWQKAHQAALGQALAMQHAIRQSYSNINRDETEAAETEQGKLNQQQQEEFQMAQDKMQELNAPGLEAPDFAGPYPGYGYPGYGGLGGIHYHFHVYPSAAR